MLWVIRLTRLAGDGLQRQGHLGFRGHGQGLGVRVEGRDHHVGHVHLLGPRRTKHTLASRLLDQCHSLPDWAPNFTKTHQTKKATSAWSCEECVQGSRPGSAAGAGWSCAAVVSAVAAAWQSKTRERERFVRLYRWLSILRKLNMSKRISDSCSLQLNCILFFPFWMVLHF